MFNPMHVPGQEDRNALCDAAAEGNVGRVRKLVRANPAYVDGTSIHGFTPLQKAAQCGHLDVVQLLVNELHATATLAGMPPSENGGTSSSLAQLSPLQLARRGKHEDIVAFLSALGDAASS
eukprot:c8838_g1_i1.p3 GENE.c8838_g1_i1~~c8838_g1_i1.p3  ORF type:complete len:134 (+),score=16.11 c8838_g1_i1:41-403(+)